jgi:hypothetical protein
MIAARLVVNEFSILVSALVKHRAVTVTPITAAQAAAAGDRMSSHITTTKDLDSGGKWSRPLGLVVRCGVATTHMGMPAEMGAGVIVQALGIRLIA